MKKKRAEALFFFTTLHVYFGTKLYIVHFGTFILGV